MYETTENNYYLVLKKPSFQKNDSPIVRNPECILVFQSFRNIEQEVG